MLSDKIALTSFGFKSSSNINILHALSFSFLIIINFFFQSYNLRVFSTYAVIFLSSLMFYFFYKMKIGKIYSLSFFYQIFLFISLTPILYLNPFILLLTFSALYLFLYFGNFFSKVQFPIGIFLILINFSLHILLSKLNILNLKIVSDEINPFSQIFPNFSGLYFPKLFLLNSEFAPESFSCLENSGLYLLLVLCLLVLKNKYILRDLLTFLSFSSILFLFFRTDSVYFYPQILNYTAIWLIFHTAPGQNSSIRYPLTITSLIPLIFLLLFYRGDNISVFSIIALYYTFYGMQFYLVTKNNFIKELFLKFEN